jgi:hypothetical protein
MFEQSESEHHLPDRSVGGDAGGGMTTKVGHAEGHYSPTMPNRIGKTGRFYKSGGKNSGESPP